jgi:RHS repeat-associated protein
VSERNICPPEVHYHRARYYQPGLRRFLNQDVLLGGIKTPASLNRYAYTNGNPVTGIDPFGLDTYIANRDLLIFGDKARSRIDIVTHTFVVTTNPDGSVKNTYSWGNNANLRGWSQNQPEDLAAAKDAIDNGLGQLVGDASLDPYINSAFNGLDKPENEHANLFFARNCKIEAHKLVNRAKLERFSAAIQQYLSMLLNFSEVQPFTQPWQIGPDQ